MDDKPKEFHVDKDSELGWMGKMLADQGIVTASFHPEQPARMIITAASCDEKVAAETNRCASIVTDHFIPGHSVVVPLLDSIIRKIRKVDGDK